MHAHSCLFIAVYANTHTIIAKDGRIEQSYFRYVVVSDGTLSSSVAPQSGNFHFALSVSMNTI